MTTTAIATNTSGNPETPDIPRHFLCPITLNLMDDPVVAQDGESYERRAMEAWMHNNPTSPLHHTAITDTRLYPNRALKVLIKAYTSAHPKVKQPDPEMDAIIAAQVKPKPKPTSQPRQPTGGNYYAQVLGTFTLSGGSFVRVVNG